MRAGVCAHVCASAGACMCVFFAVTFVTLSQWRILAAKPVTMVVTGCHILKFVDKKMLLWWVNYGTINIMDEKKPISGYHERRSQEGRAMRIAFAQTYAFLYRRRRRAGASVVGIQVLAAEMSGAGKDSWSDEQKYKTRRSMSSRFIKDPVVEAELMRLGLLKHKVTGAWYDPELD